MRLMVAYPGGGGHLTTTGTQDVDATGDVTPAVLRPGGDLKDSVEAGWKLERLEMLQV